MLISTFKCYLFGVFIIGDLCEIFFFFGEGFHYLGYFCRVFSVLRVQVRVQGASVHASPMSSLLIFVSSV